MTALGDDDSCSGKGKKNEPELATAPETIVESVEEVPVETKTPPVVNKVKDEPIGEIKEIKMSDLGPIAELDEADEGYIR